MLRPVYTIECSTDSTWEPWSLVGCWPSYTAVMAAVEEWHADEKNTDFWDLLQVREWQGSEDTVIHEYNLSKLRRAT